MATASTPTARRPWPRWIPITFWTFLAALSLVLFAYLMTLTLGAVHGVEFSPQTFERRSYSRYELPFIGVQVKPEQREDLTTVAETFLTTNKYITPPPKGAKEIWHVVVGSHGTRRLRRGDAHILMQYLDAQDAKTTHRWVKWSEDHPQLAKVFWPAVQKLAIHDLYVFLPELFELTKLHTDPVALKAALDAEVVKRLLFLARRLQDNEAHAEAIAVLTEALAIDPANKELQRARDTSKTAAR